MSASGWVAVSCLSTKTATSFFQKAALNPFSVQPVLVLGIALTQNPAIGLFEFPEVCTGPRFGPVLGLSGWHSFSLVDPPCHTAWCHWQTCYRHSQLSVSLTEMLNSTSPNTVPWGTPLVTAFHLDVEFLIATLKVQPSSQFLIHQVVHLSVMFLSSLQTKISCKTVSNALQNSR